MYCLFYINTSNKSDRLTITMTSSKSSIELHVSYFKGHSLSKSLHSRRWLKTRRRSIKIYLDRKDRVVGDPEHSKSRFGDSIFEYFYATPRLFAVILIRCRRRRKCLAHLICRPCERSLTTAIQEAKHNEFCVGTFTQTLCKTIAMSVAKPVPKVRATGSTRRSLDYIMANIKLKMNGEIYQHCTKYILFVCFCGIFRAVNEWC